MDAINKVMQYKLLLMNHFELNKTYLLYSYAKNPNTVDSNSEVTIIVNQFNILFIF